ncbi:MAG: hypothetical protein M3541_11960 [Acidobacteriota bacterium]|nr:hypothetical protein [Acidobacteriota bacterium]
MRTIGEMLFPHEEALRAIFANHKVSSAQEGLQVIVANQNRLTRDQQYILREGLVAMETSRRNAAPHGGPVPDTSIGTKAVGALPDELLAQALLSDLAEPYARAGKDRILGAAGGGPEAARYAQSYVPLTMDARDYLWGEEDMDAINQMRKDKLAELGDEEIERIMNEHKEIVPALYEHPDVAQYYPCVPATEKDKKYYPLEKALKNVNAQHKRWWTEIRELRQTGARPLTGWSEGVATSLRLVSDGRLSVLAETIQGLSVARNAADYIRKNARARSLYQAE